MKLFFFLLVSLSLFSSCQKDDVLSDAARVTQEIQRVTGSATNIDVRAYNTSQALQGEATELVIEGDFILIDQVHYNLARLVSYRYFPAINGRLKPALNLYF